jgi:hypothetical protein
MDPSRSAQIGAAIQDAYEFVSSDAGAAPDVHVPDMAAAHQPVNGFDRHIDGTSELVGHTTLPGSRSHVHSPS